MSRLPQQVEPPHHPDPTQPPGPPSPGRPAEPQRPPGRPAPPWPPDPTRPPEPAPPGPLGPVDPQDRLLAHRVVLVAGRLEHAAADLAVARLLLLDAAGPEPVELHLRCPDADLDAAATLADAVESARVLVRAVAGAVVGGAAVGVLAAADERVASASCAIALTEPRSGGGEGSAADLRAAAHRVEQLVEQLRRRVARASGRSLEQVGDDLRRGLVLSGSQALDYGLVTSVR